MRRKLLATHRAVSLDHLSASLEHDRVGSARVPLAGRSEARVWHEHTTARSELQRKPLGVLSKIMHVQICASPSATSRSLSELPRLFRVASLYLAMKASVSGVLCEADATKVKPESSSENSTHTWKLVVTIMRKKSKHRAEPSPSRTLASDAHRLALVVVLHVRAVALDGEVHLGHWQRRHEHNTEHWGLALAQADVHGELSVALDELLRVWSV